MDDSEIRILHVDDDPSLLDLTGKFLERKGDCFTLETTTNADDGFDRVEDRPPDCIVSDYDMPGTNGIEFLQAVRETHPDLPFILYTGKGSEGVASDAIAAGVTDYLQIGTSTEQYELLANRIRNAVQAYRATQKVARQEELMRLTELAGDTGGWELDLETEKLLLTEGTRRLAGLPSEDTLTLGEAFDMYHPDDRDEVRAAVDKTTRTGEETTGTWRLQPRDSEEDRLVDVTMIPVTPNGTVTAIQGAINDVTDIRERQRELKSERRFIEQSLNALNDLFYVLDTDGSIRRWNDRAVDVTGYTESELDGMDATEIFPEDEQTKIADAIGRILSNNNATVEADLRTADGDRIPYEWTGARLTGNNGKTTGLVGIGRDLRERRQRERRFQALVEESSDVISIVDADGRFQYQSPSLKRILGYDADQTIGDMAWEYIHPDDREGITKTFEEWKADPETKNSVEYRARHADGSWRWFEARGTEQFDNPAVDGYVINSRDITTRKQSEQRLQRQSRAIAEAPAGIVITGPDQEDNPLIYVNDAFVEMTGYPLEEILGENCRFLQGKNTDSERVARIREAIDNEEPISIEIRNYRKDGTEFWNHLEIAPIRDDEGGVVNWVGFQQDVTERRQNRQQLETIDRVLRHNLRNEMNVIRGRAELIHSETSGEVAQSAATIINRSDGLLETAEKERAVTDVLLQDPIKKEVALKSALQDIVSTLESEYPEATVRVECPEDVTVRATESFKQALIELAENGIIHDDSDSPEVAATVRCSDGTTHIEIADTGPQIPDIERNTLEEHAERTPVYHESGLGLWLVKLIITRSSGTITINENTPTGNIVRITFQQ